MRWRDARGSSNVQDRRGMGGPLIAGGGIGAVVLTLLYVLLGGDPADLQQAQAPSPAAQTGSAMPDDEAARFVTAVLGYTEDVWREQLPAQAGMAYQDPTLVLFSGATQSACGVGQAAMGPFYCPLDGTVYIDLTFYREMKERFGAPGDFAEAYVIAHEVGHHVQTMTGVSEQVQQARRRASEARGNELSVRQELQADCYAGLWAYHTQRMYKNLDPGDVEEALNAASAIGDDNLQRMSQGRVVPESFTHGSSAQRARWFRAGYQNGSMAACDTFNNPI